MRQCARKRNYVGIRTECTCRRCLHITALQIYAAGETVCRIRKDEDSVTALRYRACPRNDTGIRYRIPALDLDGKRLIDNVIFDNSICGKQNTTGRRNRQNHRQKLLHHSSPPISEHKKQ